VRHSSIFAAAFGAAAFFTSAPPALSAQQPRPAQLEPATATAIAPILVQARERQIPEAPLVAKARQGEVNGVPAERIAAAVRALATRLEAVRDALAPNPTVEEVRAGGDAVAARVPVETIRHMRAAQPNHSLAVPLGVLTALVARGVPLERASVEVIKLLERGAVTPQFIALDTRVREDIASGIPPDAALDLRIKGILPTLPGGGGTGAVSADGSTLQGAGTRPKRPR
jgi:hypothetical protein